jgi:hypothetical protein
VVFTSNFLIGQIVPLNNTQSGLVTRLFDVPYHADMGHKSPKLDLVAANLGWKTLVAIVASLAIRPRDDR